MFNKNQDSLHELGYLIAEASKNVVFVIGAGVSIPAGIPGWNDLNSFLVEETNNFIIQGDGTDEKKLAAIEQLNSLEDPWLLGDEIARILPRDKYIQLIRSKLSAPTPPPAYEAIWKLSPSGVVSFNLDTLAEQAMRGSSDQVASSLEQAKFSRFLLLSRPFLFQPHGRLSTPESWALGATSRNKLLRSNIGYRRFISSLLGSRRVVIAGFGPADFAFESLLLDDFRDSMVTGVDHFWITPELSIERKKWAELYNITAIEYTASSKDHPELLEILRYLGTFRPRNPSPQLAYEGATISYEDLPSDEDLRSESVEAIRQKLNAALKGGTDNLSAEQSNAFISQFYREYSGSVHMSWHVMQGPQYGRLWGCKVVGNIGSGAFANVWKVVDPVDGSLIAAKVLREETLEDPYFLEAFRRGVTAMKILAHHDVPGMVKFIRAYDIPACVFMDYIEGHTLFDAISSKMVTSLADALSIIIKVARIVLSAHRLKEGILHRDLKPSNVMITSHYSREDQEVVVLDFDLSWYQGAMGKSMTTGALHNYAAPEQLVKHPLHSSRHTAVDVFGAGMLLYFACTGQDPKLNVQNTQNFDRDTAEKVARRWPQAPGAIAESLAEVIVDATKDAQPERISLPTLIDRIYMLQDSLQNNYIPIPSDLALLEATINLDNGLWTRRREGTGKLVLQSTSSGASVSVSFTSESYAPQLLLELTYSSEGYVKRSRVGKFLKTRTDKACSLLTKNGLFDIRINSQSQGSARIEAILQKSDGTRKLFQTIAAAVADAASSLAFEEN